MSTVLYVCAVQYFVDVVKMQQMDQFRHSNNMDGDGKLCMSDVVLLLYVHGKTMRYGL